MREKGTTPPASQGYFMPAEWAPHEATWLAWPHNRDTWPGKRLERVRAVFLQMMEALLCREKVHLLIQNERERDHVEKSLRARGAELSRWIPHISRTADAWIRDYGPTFLIHPQGKKAWCKWRFNAWGNKDPQLKKDGGVFEDPALLPPESVFYAPFVLEGGAIEVNGAGTCLVTESCLLSPNRNAHFSKNDLEQNLKNFLGIRHCVWLDGGIAGDDTDGHIDNLARFVDAQTIVAVSEADPADENYSALRANWERLKGASDDRGRVWNLIRLPMPDKIKNGQRRLPASYANFYIANGLVLAPAFDDPQDDRCMGILREIFPKHEVMAIDCRDAVVGLGAIHCLTQQEPSALTLDG